MRDFGDMAIADLDTLISYLIESKAYKSDMSLRKAFDLAQEMSRREAEAYQRVHAAFSNITPITSRSQKRGD